MQQINLKGPGELINKVDAATSDRCQICSSLLLNGKVNFSKVKVILGHMTVSCAISKFNLGKCQ